MLAPSRLIFSKFLQRRVVRNYSTVKPTLAYISQIRKKTEVSISKAKEALVATNNDLEKALLWLEEDLLKSGAKKASKLADRVAGEGLVGVATSNSSDNSISQGVLVEVCCETDFVTRNSMFQQLVNDIVQSSLVNFGSNATTNSVSEIPLQSLMESKLSENNVSVKDAISETVAKLGENIILRRAVVTCFKKEGNSFYYTAGSTHGGTSVCGRIGGLVVLESVKEPSELCVQFSRQLSRQVVGLNPECVQETDKLAVKKKNTLSPSEYSEFLGNSVLLNQNFLFGEGTIQEKLEELKKSQGVDLKINSFARLVAGEGIEKAEALDFRSEVLKQVEQFN